MAGVRGGLMLVALQRALLQLEPPGRDLQVCRIRYRKIHVLTRCRHHPDLSRRRELRRRATECVVPSAKITSAKRGEEKEPPEQVGRLASRDVAIIPATPCGSSASLYSAAPFLHAKKSSPHSNSKHCGIIPIKSLIELPRRLRLLTLSWRGS